MSFWNDLSHRGARGARRTWATGLVVVACLWLLAVAVASAPARGAPAAAHAARTISVKDTGQLHLVEESGGQLIEEGPASGTLPGSVRARITLGTTVRLGFTIYLHGGTISGHGAAKLNPGKGAFASFSGSLTVSHGSGHYAHASGSGGLFGTIDRNANDNAVVQVVGRLHV